MSITERPVDSALKSLLVDNEPYKYAHLVKFERPSKLVSTLDRVSTSAKRYTYLTDGSVNVSFDDLSRDRDGNFNGPQTYIANKLLKVGAIQEQTKATPSQTSIGVIGNALGAFITGTADIANSSVGGDWTITYSDVTVDDIVQEGFREGDKISVNGTLVNIYSFRSTNQLVVEKIDDNLSTGTSITVELSLSSEEIISILLNKNADDYASFINREVFIYRAYFDADGVAVGDPIPLFKGIIYNVSFEDNEGEIRVNWGLTSHWGDFAQVKGRITSDDFHRALDENGKPQPESAIRHIYAYDKGFNHAETSINAISTYTVLVDTPDFKFKKGFIGLFSKAKMDIVSVPEDRTTKLDFQLQGKSIPVVYGVRKIEGNLIFADTKATDSSEVYTAQVLCEGEIGGLYDLYIESNSLICNNQEDYDARAAGVTRSADANDSIPLTCVGRADRGDVLSGDSALGSTEEYYDYDYDSLYFSGGYPSNFWWEQWAYENVPELNSQNTQDSPGLVDGDSVQLTSPQEITLDLFSGKPGQKAASSLVTIASQNGFKIQNSYWAGKDTYEYWGPNHRLIDSAYIVQRTIIKEGETSLPEITYVVKGKVIPCYNYDYSYAHDQKATSEDPDNFALGDTVTLYNGNDIINDNVTIIDKWSFYDPNGNKQWRFRFSSTPALGYVDSVPAITKFYMKNGSNNTWTMLTFNHDLINGAIPTTLEANVDSLSDSSDIFSIGFSGAATGLSTVTDAGSTSPSFRLVDSNREKIAGADIANSIMYGTISGSTLTTKYPYSLMEDQIPSSLTGLKLASVNTVKLPASASSTNDYYVGYMIEVSLYDTVTGKTYIQEEEIIGYDGTNKIATIAGIWYQIPTSDYNVRVYPKWADSRVSINPAIQTLDYVTSKIYGKGLDPYLDLDLPSWCEAARKCDERSTVTVRSTNTINASVGAVYRYPESGNVKWKGTLLSKHDGDGGTSGIYAEFTDVIGKLTNKWNSWKTWKTGDIIYNPETYVLFIVESDTVIATAPTATVTGVVTELSTLSIYKESGTGDAAIPLELSLGNPVQSKSRGQKISGYSLYDSDSIDYWRLCGWDEHDQRYVTKFQTNIQLDTSQPLFDNINALLQHFNGIMRYTSGKYYLDIESIQDDLSSDDVRIITENDIVGKIQLSDEGTRRAYNSLTASFADPSNKFEPRNISFFNSDYLKADRNVPKKGNLTVPGVTNYYNTRLLAETSLNRSRYGLSANLTVRSHGILLLAGTVIEIIYPRYDWGSYDSLGNPVGPGKKFRIESITYQPDGLNDLVVKEYDDSLYNRTHISSAPVSGPNTGPSTSRIVGAPTALAVTSADTSDELLNGVELVWTNSPSATSDSTFTEIYGGLSPNIFVTVSSISSNTITTSSNHDLQVGMLVYPETSENGFDLTKAYYVTSVPDTTTFTVSETKGGSSPTLTDGTGLSLRIRTATLLASVPVPTRSYIDTVVNEGTGRVEKYYWVRHKVV